MKVVILAGGLGTRISEESHLLPKPMIEIGRKPILWHIMKIYSHYGFNDFVICAGYKQNVIKEYFANFYLHNSDITFDLSDNSTTIESSNAEPWRVTVVDTGYQTMTGGRIKRIQKYIGDEPFFLTYGDAVADVDIPALLGFHRRNGHIATLTAANIAQQKGVLSIDESGTVQSFREKEEGDSMLINGGFMVLEPEIFSYIDGDETIFEQGPLQRLSEEEELDAYRHEGFWQCMDTQREKKKLETLWESDNAPWKIWEE